MKTPTEEQATTRAKSIAALKLATVSRGGSWEEDDARPGMRCFQAVTSFGRVWHINGCKCYPVEISTGAWGDDDKAHVLSALAAMAPGHRAMTADEAFVCDEEI